MKARLFLIGIVLVVVALAISAIGFAADCNTVLVLPENIIPITSVTPTTVLPQGSFVKSTRGNGSASLVAGPATPPLGVGSLKLVTPGPSDPNATDKVTLFNYDHIGTPLSSINGISYSTYRDPSSTAVPVQAPALNIEIDYNGPNVAGGFTTLVFEPVYNVVAQGPVIPGQWQNWDAYAGGSAIWWSTRDIPGVCAFNCFVSWHDIVAANPNATILGGFGVNQGGGNDGLIGYVDALRLSYGADNCVTYNFEPYRVATTKDDCKNGGYNSVKDAQGNSFKNQGQCIQFVNNGK